PNGDKLILRGMIFHGYHGVYDEEKKLGQKFLVDADVWTDLSKACNSDNIEDSISYGAIYRIVKAVVEGPPFSLLEAVAASIAKGVFERFPSATSIRVRVGKPHVAVKGSVDYLGVEIFRRNPSSNKEI
ncbi:hypothetical protein SELMODRAFT_84592, partial [Selaginella moellendorffii]